MYKAAATHICNYLVPYSWYKRFVVEGARHHGVPDDYIALIEAMPDIEDTNRERDARNRIILSAPLTECK
jgi:gamma-glutamylcyclotransferase